MKRFISLLLAAIILMSCGITCFAAGSTEKAPANERKTDLRDGLSDFFDKIASFFKRLWNKILNILGFGFKFTGDDYSIPEIDLSTLPDELRGTEYEYLYDLYVIDDSRDYMAHPDSVLLNNGDILTFYPKGHGKGAILSKISDNGGVSYDKEIENPPSSWEKSLETPTVYRLQFKNGDEKLILIKLDSNSEGNLARGKVRNRQLEEIDEEVQSLKLPHAPCTELSMGMSNDYKYAIKHNATYIRVGTLLFN